MIGHHIGICKRFHPAQHDNKEKEPAKNRRQGKEPEKHYVVS